MMALVAVVTDVGKDKINVPDQVRLEAISSGRHPVEHPAERRPLSACHPLTAPADLARPAGALLRAAPACGCYRASVTVIGSFGQRLSVSVSAVLSAGSMASR